MTLGIRIFGDMRGWLEKLRARMKISEEPTDGKQSADESRTDLRNQDGVRDEKSEDATSANERLGSGTVDGEPPKPGDGTSVPVMVEILKLLARIEYGLDVEQIANSLAISQEDARANCDALEQEMFVHHHESAEEWFIGQRGLEFLRLNGESDAPA